MMIIIILIRLMMIKNQEIYISLISAKSELFSAIQEAPFA